MNPSPFYWKIRRRVNTFLHFLGKIRRMGRSGPSSLPSWGDKMEGWAIPLFFRKQGGRTPPPFFRKIRRRGRVVHPSPPPPITPHLTALRVCGEHIVEVLQEDASHGPGPLHPLRAVLVMFGSAGSFCSLGSFGSENLNVGAGTDFGPKRGSGLWCWEVPNGRARDCGVGKSQLE